MDTPPNDLDARALGRAAPGKGLAREACPYAEGTEARTLWLAGYDAALSDGVAPVTGGLAKHPIDGSAR
ncbi:ribosome modulation factor [Methylobacterium sp. P5_C11]